MSIMHRQSLFLLALTTTFTIGCAKKGSVSDYVPPQEAARTALSTALDAWKAGKAPDQVGATKPAINAQDVQWSGGKKLTAYEIVGPATGDDQNQRFTVKLTLDGGAPQETTYVVVGKDPIWVFSEESYKKASGI
jgi:hypothetical protein